MVPISWITPRRWQLELDGDAFAACLASGLTSTEPKPEKINKLALIPGST